MNDPWIHLRRYTQARIALGAAGAALPTSAHLDFCEAHAAARDAVHARWSSLSFCAELAERGMSARVLQSSATARDSYLRRPDLGRRLSEDSAQVLTAIGKDEPTRLALVMSDGLSALAVERHGLPLLSELVPALADAGLSPVRLVLIPLSRVAIGDEVGELLGAELSLVILGERPGLSAADGLGAYLTYAPRRGKTDAERNCVSNIRPPDGLSLEDAVHKIVYLSRQALIGQLTGVGLKDESQEKRLDAGASDSS